MWIPAIDVRAPLTPLGLNPDGTLEVPERWEVAGWFTGMPRPGEKGPSIIAGHVDSAEHGPAVFFRLHELAAGDLVHVVYDTGYVATFALRRQQQVPKDDFPTQEVYGPTGYPAIRLITCGGSFNRASGHYRDNIILYGAIHASWHT